MNRQLVLLCDLDGVLRTFDRVNRGFAAIEREHDLPSNAMMDVAFESRMLDLAITGRITHAEWVERTHEQLRDVYGRLASDLLIECWVGDRGEVVPEVLRTVSDLRSNGWHVVLATNATTRLREDLSRLRIDEVLDDVVNSSDIGHAKPEKSFFVHAQTVTKVPVNHILFVDDKPANVAGGKACDIEGVVFTSADQLRSAADAFAVNVLGPNNDQRRTRKTTGPPSQRKALVNDGGETGI